MEDQKDVKIEKMVLNIEGEKVSLSMEQAKKLKKVLDDLFGRDVIKEIHTEHHYRDWYRQPFYWGTAVNPKSPFDNIVYCDAKASSLEVTV